MSSRKVTCVGLIALLVILFLGGSAKAWNFTTTIYRGQYDGEAMASGDVWTVYYNPDGTYPTLTAWEPVSSWLTNPKVTPVTVMNVSIWSARYGWQFVNSYQITPWTTYVPLYGAKGTQYRFDIHNYQQDTPVFIGVH